MPARSGVFAGHAGGEGGVGWSGAVYGHCDVCQHGKDPFTVTWGALSHFQPHKEHFTHLLKRAFSHSHTTADTQTQLLTSCSLFSLSCTHIYRRTQMDTHAYTQTTA